MLAATKTAGLIAAVAARRTLLAVTVITIAAIANIVAVHNISTVIAGLALPVGKRNVGAVRVICLKDTSNHRKEIAETALLK